MYGLDINLIISIADVLLWLICLNYVFGIKKFKTEVFGTGLAASILATSGAVSRELALVVIVAYCYIAMGMMAFFYRKEYITRRKVTASAPENSEKPIATGDSEIH